MAGLDGVRPIWVGHIHMVPGRRLAVRTHARVQTRSRSRRLLGNPGAVADAHSSPSPSFTATAAVAALPRAHDCLPTRLSRRHRDKRYRSQQLYYGATSSHRHCFQERLEHPLLPGMAGHTVDCGSPAVPSPTPPSCCVVHPPPLYIWWYTYVQATERAAIRPALSCLVLSSVAL